MLVRHTNHTEGEWCEPRSGGPIDCSLYNDMQFRDLLMNEPEIFKCIHRKRCQGLFSPMSRWTWEQAVSGYRISRHKGKLIKSTCLFHLETVEQLVMIRLFQGVVSDCCPVLLHGWWTSTLVYCAPSRRRMNLTHRHIYSLTLAAVND